MIYISYATKNTPYIKVLEKYLHPSLHKWNLHHDIQYIDDRGSWTANTHYKATFIKKMLLKHKQAVCFLDSDASIEDYPTLLMVGDIYCKYDIGLHYLDWYKFWRKIDGQKKREVLSGTLYLNYNEKVLQFLDEWIKENKKNTSWEQKNMQWVLRSWKQKLRMYPLPPEYCCIVLPNEKIPYYYLTEKPVILHHQVSRKYKN